MTFNICKCRTKDGKNTIITQNYKLPKAPMRTFENKYTSLVRPTLEYGCFAWDPHQANRSQMLESIQNKGARYVTQEWSRHSSISDIKDKLGWCKLQQRRYVNRLSFFCKSVNNLHVHSLPPYVTRQNELQTTIKHTCTTH